MEAFYRSFQEVRTKRFDGLVITGAPIDHLPFEGVTYWDELTEVMDWTQTHVHSTFGVCWGGGNGDGVSFSIGLQKYMLAARRRSVVFPSPEPRPRLALPARVLPTIA